MSKALILAAIYEEAGLGSFEEARAALAAIDAQPACPGHHERHAAMAAQGIDLLPRMSPDGQRAVLARLVHGGWSLWDVRAVLPRMRERAA